MARSQYIYVPFDGDVAPGYFTVKHEMITYLRRYFPTTKVLMMRYRDNGGPQGSVVEEDHRISPEG